MEGSNGKATSGTYAVFSVIDVEGAKALLPVAIEEATGEPKGYTGKTRREAIKAAIAAGDTSTDHAPFRAIPVRSLGTEENPKPKEPALAW